MMERVVIAGALLGLTGLAMLGFRLVPLLWRVRLRHAAPDVLFFRNDQRLTLLYFYTKHCVDCRVRQAPALERLERSFPGRFSLVKIDGEENGALAGQYQILTVPSTVILSPEGRVLDANFGFAPEERLRAQLGLEPKRAGAPLESPLLDTSESGGR